MTIRKYLSALMVVALGTAALQADSPRRYRRSYAFEPTPTRMPMPTEIPVRITREAPEKPETSGPKEAVSGEDALAEVNAARAKRGLPAYQPDPILNKAALACAKQRAARLIAGHLPESDFSYLPSGGSATAAGCAAWTPDWGWGSCCTYDSYTYAGAAWVMGQDGQRYMHLFVR